MPRPTGSRNTKTLIKLGLPVPSGRLSNAPRNASGEQIYSEPFKPNLPEELQAMVDTIQADISQQLQRNGEATYSASAGVPPCGGAAPFANGRVDDRYIEALGLD